MAPALLVGIDTESDNQWSAASRANPTYENIDALPRLHEVFRRYAVRPTYLITWPVATDPRSAQVLRGLRESGTCEIGAHHHAWETPPFTDADVRGHVYASTLPRARFVAQLASLTEAIAGGVGSRPVSYRSGRFGFAAGHTSPLEDAGYQADSSLAPLFYEAHKGGPDFADTPLVPYYLSYDRATRPGSSRVIELPLSCALNRRWPTWAQLLWARAPRPYTTRRVLKKLGIVRVMWLRPSYSSYEDMVSLADRLVADRVPLLNLLFHSSEAIIGGSPYNKNDDELRAFFDRLERFLAYAIETLGATPMTFSEFVARYTSRH